MKNCVHIYMGKNWMDLKTAQGMALRACGAGFSVGFFGFDEAASRLPNLQFVQNLQQDISQFDMVFLTERDFADFDQDELLKFLADKPQSTEIVLCGEVFSDDVLAVADLVSEILKL